MVEQNTQPDPNNPNGRIKATPEEMAEFSQMPAAERDAFLRRQAAVSRMLKKDPGLYEGQTVYSIAKRIADPYAASEMYDELATRHGSVTIERDAFVQNISGRTLEKVKPDPNAVKTIAQFVKQRNPQFNGDISASDLATAWATKGDVRAIYEDIKSIGLADMSYTAFEKVMKEPPKLAPYKDPYQNKDRGLLSFGTEAKDDLKPANITGSEDPLSYGIEKMGNYNDQMKVYMTDDPKLQQSGNIEVGAKAISMYEDDVNETLMYHEREFNKKHGQDALKTIVEEYSALAMAANVNPDRAEAQRDLQAFTARNKQYFDDPNMQGALNAMKGLGAAAQRRNQLFKENPEGYKEMLVTKAQQEDWWTPIDPATGKRRSLEGLEWLAKVPISTFNKSFQSVAKGVFDVIARSTDADWAKEDYKIASDRYKVMSNPEYEGKTGYQYFLPDENNNIVIIDPNTRKVLAAETASGDTIENYEPSDKFRAKARVAPLEGRIDVDSGLHQLGQLISDVTFDALLGAATGGVATGLGVGVRGATMVGVAAPAFLREMEGAIQEAMDAGKSNSGALWDVMLRGSFIASTSYLLGGVDKALVTRAIQGAETRALNQALARYATGQVTARDMLMEFAKGTAKMSGKEALEEGVQDIGTQVVYGHINNSLFGTRFDASMTPGELGETLLLSAIVGGLGGSPQNTKYLMSKNALVDDGIRAMVHNPEKARELLKAMELADPELAKEKRQYFESVMQQLDALKPSENVKAQVARLIIERDTVQNRLDKLGRMAPKDLRENSEALIASLDKSITDLLTAKPEETAEAAEVAAEGMVVPEMEEVTAAAEEVVAPTYEEQVRAETRPMEAPESAWTLRDSTNPADVAGYEIWRLNSLDKKPTDLTPEERAVFGDALDDTKTVREQLGEKAGIPKLAPRPIPEDETMLDKLLTAVGFLTTTDPKTKEKGVQLFRRRQQKQEAVTLGQDADGKFYAKRPKEKKEVWMDDEGNEAKGPVTESIYYLDPEKNTWADAEGAAPPKAAATLVENAPRVTRGGTLMYLDPAERKGKLRQIRKAIQEVKDNKGTVEDLRIKLDELNVAFSPAGNDIMWNQKGKRMAHRLYQDALFESMLTYEKPKAPKVKSVTIKTKDGDQTYTYNEAESRWEDKDGNPAKGMRLKQIERELAKQQIPTNKLAIIANKKMMGKDLTEEEKGLEAKYGKEIEQIIKQKTRAAAQKQRQQARAATARKRAAAKKAKAKAQQKKEFDKLVKTAGKEALEAIAAEAGKTAAESAPVRAAVQRIRDLKITGRAFDATLGIPVAVWNSAVELVALGLEAGMSIAQAVNRGIDYIKQNYQEDWNEDAAKSQLAEAAQEPELKPASKKDLRTSRLIEKPVEDNSRSLPDDVVEQIDAYVEDAVENGTPVRASEIFPEGMPPGVTEATIQARYLRAMRGNKGAIIQMAKDQMNKKRPAPEATAADRAKLDRLRRAPFIPSVEDRVLSRFELRRRARTAKGELKKTYQFLEQVSKTFSNSAGEVKVYVHDSLESYHRGIKNVYKGGVESTSRVAISSAGIYMDNQIHIFVGAENFDAQRVLHEAVHPMLIEAMATHPELYRTFVKRLMSDPDLFNRYWVNFAWENYTDTVPQDAEEAAQLLDNLDNEAVTEMLSGEVMQKLMENLSKQKPSIKQRLQQALIDLLDAVGLTNAAQNLYKRMFEKNEAFDNFFDDIKTVEQFAEKFANALANRKSIPLRHLFSRQGELFASAQQFENLQKVKDILDHIYLVNSYYGNTIPTEAEIIESLSDQIASGEFDLDMVKEIYRSYLSQRQLGMQEDWYYQRLEEEDMSAMEIYFNKATMMRIAEEVGGTPYEPGHRGAQAVLADATQDITFGNVQEADLAARAILDGGETVLPDYRRTAMGMTLIAIEKDIQRLEMSIENMQARYADIEYTDPDTTTGKEFQTLTRNRNGLRVVADNIRTALLLDGSAKGRQLAMIRWSKVTKDQVFSKVMMDKLSTRANKQQRSQVRAIAEAYDKVYQRVERLMAQSDEFNRNRYIDEFVRHLRTEMAAGRKFSYDYMTLIDKWAKQRAPSASRNKPLFLTTKDSPDMMLFLYDLKQVTIMVGMDNMSKAPGDRLTDTEIAEKVVQLYRDAGIEINDMDVFVAMTADAPLNIEKAKSDYEIWKEEMTANARMAQNISKYVDDWADQMQKRLRDYRKELKDKREAVRARDLYDTPASMKKDRDLVYETLAQLRAAAAVAEILPSEYDKLIRNVEAVERRFGQILSQGYPIDEKKIDEIIANIRKVNDFFAGERVQQSIAEVNDKINRLRRAKESGNPREVYELITELRPMGKRYRDPELVKEREKLQKLRDELRKAVDTYNHRLESPILFYAGKIADTVRTSKTMADASAVLNQGRAAVAFFLTDALWNAMRGNFKESKESMNVLGKALSNAYSAGWTEFVKGSSAVTVKVWDEMQNHPYYGIMRNAGLALTPPRDGSEVSEEMFRATYFDDLGDAVNKKFTGDTVTDKSMRFVGNSLVRIKDASEAHYVTFLNVLRFEMFKKQYEMLANAKDGQVTAEELEYVAEAINVASGRANTLLGKPMPPTLNHFLWAPRYYLAQAKSIGYIAAAPIQMARHRAMKYTNAYKNASPEQKRDMEMRNASMMRAQEYRFKVAASSLVGLATNAALMQGMMKWQCGEEGGISTDFTKSTFLKFVCRDEVYDLSGGIAWWFRVATQMADRIGVAHFMYKDMTTGYYSRQDLYDLIWDGTRSKFNPILQSTLGFFANKDFRGRPYGRNTAEALGNVLVEAMVPISVSSGISLLGYKATLTEGFVKEGPPEESVLMGITKGVLMVHGMNYYRSDNAMNNLLVVGHVAELNEELMAKGETALNPQPRPDDEFEKKNDPFAHAKFKEEFNKRVSAYIVEELRAGRKPTADEIRGFASKTSKEINAEFQAKLAAGEEI